MLIITIIVMIEATLEERDKNEEISKRWDNTQTEKHTHTHGEKKSTNKFKPFSVAQFSGNLYQFPVLTLAQLIKHRLPSMAGPRCYTTGGRL